VARIDLDLQEVATVGGASTARISDDTTAFATTFAGGLTWHATDRIELYGEARYTTVYGAGFDRSVTGTPGVQSLDDDFNTASLVVGSRIGF
jgi:opacity protein-like surface antigen